MKKAHTTNKSSAGPKEQANYNTNLESKTPQAKALNGVEVLPNHSFGFYDSHSSTKPSKHLSLGLMAEIIKAPYNTEKSQLPLITPFDGAGKTKTTAEKANYWCAVIDYDGVEIDIANITADLYVHGYDGALLYFTTSSHGSTTDKNGKPKAPNHYKIILPFDEPVNAETYHTISTGLGLLLGSDMAQGRAQQGFYAPNSKTAGLPYSGDALNLNDGFLTPNSDLFKAATTEYNQHEKAKAATPKPRNLAVSGGVDSGGIIDLINAAYDLPSLLKKYNHKQHGKKWLSPHSNTKTAGGIILSNGRFYSHHGEACPLSDLNNDWHSLDTADVLCLLKYHGNYSAMVKSEAQNLDQDGQKNRQRAHMEHQERLSDAMPPLNNDVIDQDLANGFDVIAEPKNEGKIYDVIKNTVIGRRAKDIALSVEMPVDTACLAGLGVFSSVLAGARSIERRGGGKVPAGLYIAAEQPPSTGKSRIIDGFRVPLIKQINKINKELADQAIAEAGSEEKPKPARQINLFITDATPEALDLVAKNNNGLFSIVSDEQAAIDTLLGLNYGEKSKGNNNGLVLNGFAGEWFSSARVSRSGFKGYVYGGVTVLAQQGTTRKIVQGSQGQGVVERFILWNEPNLLGARNLNYHEITTENEYNQVSANLAGLCRAEFTKENSSFTDLPALKISTKGWALILGLRKELEPQLADGKKFSHPLLRGAAGKMDMQIMKIAATLHIADQCLDLATPDKTYWLPHHEISDKYVQMAIDVVKITLHQLIRTLEVNGVIGRDAYIDALAEYLSTRNQPMTYRTIYQNQKNRPIFKDTPSASNTIKEALQRLVDFGIVAAKQEIVGNKPVIKYKMH